MKSKNFNSIEGKLNRIYLICRKSNIEEIAQEVQSIVNSRKC